MAKLLENPQRIEKKKKHRKWKIFLFVLLGICLLLGIWLVCFVNRQIRLERRDNYDPLIVDEEACRELVKVENCLNAFFEDYTYDESLDEYLYGSFLPDAEPESIRDIKGVTQWWYRWYNGGLSYKEAEEWRKVISTHQKWYENLRPKLEYYLYTQCKSDILPMFPEGYENIEIVHRLVYESAAEKKILQYFNDLYTPALHYSELLNDDNESYQVWAISKESDPDRESDIIITVFFDSEQRRSHIRLFHPKN